MPPPSQAPAPVTKKKVKSKVPLARRQLPPPDDPPSDNLSNGDPEDSEEDTREDRSSLSSDEDQDVPVKVNPHSDSMMLIQNRRQRPLLVQSQSQRSTSPLRRQIKLI